MRITFLHSKTFFLLTFVFALIFITWGDIILPKPLNHYSRNTRHKLEQVLIGIFLNFDAKVEKPSEKREEQLQKFEQKAAPLFNKN